MAEELYRGKLSGNALCYFFDLCQRNIARHTLKMSILIEMALKINQDVKVGGIYVENCNLKQSEDPSQTCGKTMDACTIAETTGLINLDV